MPEDEDKGASPSDGRVRAVLRRWGGPIVSAAVSLTIGLINARISPIWAWAALALAALWTFFALMTSGPIKNLTRRKRRATGVFSAIALAIIWWLLVTQVLRPPIEAMLTPAEIAADVVRRLGPMLSATKTARTEQTLSLSVIASLESNAQSKDGDFWVVRNAAPRTLIAANRACFLRAVNLQDYPIGIDRLNAEALLANGNWEQMRRVTMIGTKEIYYGDVLSKMMHIDLASLSFEMNTETVPAKRAAEGWIFFDRPRNASATPLRIRISVTDDHGNTVWATGAPTMSAGGLRGAPLPIIGFDDLSGYSVRRLPGDR